MTESPTVRPLPLWAFGVIVVVYLAIIQVAGTVIEQIGHHDDTFTSVEGVLWNMWLPLGTVPGILAHLGVGGIPLARRHHIEPAGPAATSRKVAGGR